MTEIGETEIVMPQAEPWPADNKKRSRPNHFGFFGLWRMKRV